MKKRQKLKKEHFVLLPLVIIIGVLAFFLSTYALNIHTDAQRVDDLYDIAQKLQNDHVVPEGGAPDDFTVIEPIVLHGKLSDYSYGREGGGANYGHRASNDPYASTRYQLCATFKTAANWKDPANLPSQPITSKEAFSSHRKGYQCYGVDYSCDILTAQPFVEEDPYIASHELAGITDVGRWECDSGSEVQSKRPATAQVYPLLTDEEYPLRR